MPVLRRDELRARVEAFPYWYQRIDLGDGLYTTAGPLYHEVVWERLRPAFPSDLRGASVLDVGCNAGYFSIEAKRLNAGRVVGVESEVHYLAQAEICRDALGLDIEYRRGDVHAIATLQERFDVVVFTGLLYHLKSPLLALEAAAALCRDAIVVETECLIEGAGNTVTLRQGPLNQVAVAQCHTGIMKFIETDELNGDRSNWWVPDTECVKGMLRTAGYRHFSSPLYLFEGSRLLLAASKTAESILHLDALRP